MAKILLTSPDLGIASRPYQGFTYCGDQAASWLGDDGRVGLALADGLGHGRDAEEAARAALLYLESHWEKEPETVFPGCDASIAHTRGAAVALAVVSADRSSLTFSGAGNIRIAFVGERIKNFVVTPGIVGSGHLRVRSETMRLNPFSCIVMFTDGIQSRINLLKCSSSLFEDMRRLASTIVCDWGRKDDDVGVVAWRCKIDADKRNAETQSIESDDKNILPLKPEAIVKE
ncbi:phosphoserine phosphatase RsbX [Azospirillaceae bacterium]